MPYPLKITVFCACSAVADSLQPHGLQWLHPSSFITWMISILSLRLSSVIFSLIRLSTFLHHGLTRSVYLCSLHTTSYHCFIIIYILSPPLDVSSLMQGAKVFTFESLTRSILPCILWELNKHKKINFKQYYWPLLITQYYYIRSLDRSMIRNQEKPEATWNVTIFINFTSQRATPHIINLGFTPRKRIQ